MSPTLLTKSQKQLQISVQKAIPKNLHELFPYGDVFTARWEFAVKDTNPFSYILGIHWCYQTTDYTLHTIVQK